MKKLLLLPLLIFFSAPVVLNAQIQLCQKKSEVPGQVTVHSSDLLDSLTAQRLWENEKRDGMSGYRVQIYFGTDKNEAMKARTDFLKLFPEDEAYINYEKPYFTIRVGDFRDRFEAQRMLGNIRLDYPNAIVVPDKKIQYPPLSSSR